MLIEYLKVFAVGGALCAIGQLLIDKTKLTPARILTVYVVSGLILEAAGLYSPLVKWAGAGATVPLTGFGSTLARGVEKAVSERGEKIKKRPAGRFLRFLRFLLICDLAYAFYEARQLIGIYPPGRIAADAEFQRA